LVDALKDAAILAALLGREQVVEELPGALGHAEWGRIVAWGRRPWLALVLPTLFRNP